jgi:hypothetical protein
MQASMGGSGFGGDSAPATPLEKYYILKDEYLRMGKGWEWEAMRDYVRAQYHEKGWPDNHFLMTALNSIHDQDYNLDPERARLLRLDDTEAKREQDALAAAARQKVIETEGRQYADSDAQRELAELRHELAEMKSLLGAQARNETHPATAVVEPAVASDPDPLPDDLAAAATSAEAAVAGGTPNVNWSKKELFSYAERNGITIPDEMRGQFVGKATVVDHILGEMEKES